MLPTFSSSVLSLIALDDMLEIHITILIRVWTKLIFLVLQFDYNLLTNINSDMKQHNIFDNSSQLHSHIMEKFGKMQS